MLEKEQGNIKTEKLRAILLMEADFNFANKLAFGNRMQNRAEDKSYFPMNVTEAERDAKRWT